MMSHRDFARFVRAAAMCAAAAAMAAVAIPSAEATTHAAAWRHVLSWKLVDTDTQTHFRGLAVVSGKVAWLGGYGSCWASGDLGRVAVLHG